MLSTREAYGLALAELGGRYDFFVLDADLSKATQTEQFAKKYPERFINMGIAEGNMMAVAAGIATCGTPVFASTFAAFAAGRAYDAIRNAIAYPSLNVKIGATHGGVLIGADGGSHQCIEDIALMRAIPGMVVLCPADEVETRACVQAALEHIGPVYLRFGRFPAGKVFDQGMHFEIGQGKLLREGSDVTIIAVGDLVYHSLLAAESLKTQGISAEIIDMASIKPLDEALILASAKKTGLVVTAEDHNVNGGLGGAVAELLAKKLATKMAMIGIQDQFGRSGAPTELAAHYGLSPDSICSAVKTLLKGK